MVCQMFPLLEKGGRGDLKTFQTAMLTYNIKDSKAIFVVVVLEDLKTGR